MDYKPVDNVDNFVNNWYRGFSNVDKKLSKNSSVSVDNVDSKD